jgi:hyperosmotically inducible protein
MTSPKKIVITCLAVAALIMTVNASAQTDTGTAGSSPQQSKKVTRAQNRLLQKNVWHALTKAKKLNSSAIIVETRGGVVTLDGTVPSDEEIQLATDAAGSVSGVSTVKNNLTTREAGN